MPIRVTPMFRAREDAMEVAGLISTLKSVGIVQQRSLELQGLVTKVIPNVTFKFNGFNFTPGLAGLLGRLVNFDLDLAGPGRFLLREGDGQEAVLVFGADFVGFHRVWEGKAADEISVAALDTVIALGAFVLFELAHALKGQGHLGSRPDRDVERIGGDGRSRRAQCRFVDPAGDAAVRHDAA